MTKDIEQINQEIEDELFQDYLNKFRKEYIPERYNQVKLLSELNNPDIDHFISISNRTDGKTFNYVHGLLNIALDYDIGLFFLARNSFLRDSYISLIEEIAQHFPTLDPNKFSFVRFLYYHSVNYNGKTIGVIADLSQASQLKNFSNFIKNFPIIIYDEFLALDSDYLNDEWERLKTIYESIDRKSEYPLIHKPKIFYFGNAVNFNSPILNGLDIYNILEEHKINTARIYKYKFNVMLEMNKNINANEGRNTRAFASDEDSMTTGEFKTNPHFIANDDDRKEINKSPRTFYIKLVDNYIKVMFNKDTFKIILSVTSVCENDDYIYNLELKDNKPNSTYLDEKYFDEKHYKRIDKGHYLFENNFSRNFIASDYGSLNMLKFHKLINEFLINDKKSDLDHKEKQFKYNYIEEAKRYLLKKLGNDF